ncbi:MAG: hypothetical protein ACLUI3_17810, partial [Christensenellales bacterium]
MKNKWIAALALTGLLLTTGAYAESTPSETGAPVQAEAAAEPQHQLKVTTKYRYFISQYHYIRERKVSYFDNVYAYNHGEYGLTPFASTVPEEYFVADENGTLAIAPIVLDITDAMRELAVIEGMVGVEYEGVRYDMGNKLGILQAIVEVGLQHPEVGED